MRLVLGLAIILGCSRDASVPLGQEQPASHAQRIPPISEGPISADPCEKPPFRVSNDLRTPRVLVKVEPDFSSCDQAETTVFIETVIGVDGKPRNVRVLRSASECLDRMALEAVKQWTFCPAKRSGEPVEITMIFTFKKSQTAV